MRRSLVYLVGLLFIVGSLGVIACGGGTSDSGSSSSGSSSTVAISMDDQGGTYTMVPSPTSIAAGSVTFDISNVGLIAHEFKVVKLNDAGMAADLTDLPTEGGLISESGNMVDGVGTVLGSLLEADLPAGGEDELTLTLEAGEYMLLCNVATHYQLGMWSEFTVT